MRLEILGKPYVIFDAVISARTREVISETGFGIDLDQYSMVHFDIRLQRWLDKLIIVASNSQPTLAKSDDGKSLIQEASQNIPEFDLEADEIEKIIELSNHLLQIKMNSLFRLLARIGINSQNINVLQNVRWILEKKNQPMIKDSSTFSLLSDDLNNCIHRIAECNASYMKDLMSEM